MLGRQVSSPKGCSQPSKPSWQAVALQARRMAAPPPTKPAAPRGPEPLRPGEVFYFAYGSNMSPEVLTQRRFVKPRESLPCFLPDHLLSFRMIGVPYVEPGFATIEPTGVSSACSTAPDSSSSSPSGGLSGKPGSSSSSLKLSSRPQEDSQQLQQQQGEGPVGFLPLASAPQGCVHGVLHRITGAEWGWVTASEGVGSKNHGYQVVEVLCHTYEGAPVKALTLRGLEASLHTNSRQAAPSARYLKLLRDGAAHHNLAPSYQQFLVELQPYVAQTWSQTFGMVAGGLVMLGAASPAIPVYITGRVLSLLPAAPRTGERGPTSPSAAMQSTGKGLGTDPSPSAEHQEQQWVQPDANSADRASQVEPTSSMDSRGRWAEAGRTRQQAIDGDLANAAAGGLFPYLTWYFNQASQMTWWVHDFALDPLLGSGCSSSSSPSSSGRQ